MNCSCNNNLSEKPEGIKAIFEEYKVPICVGGVVICSVFLYRKFGNNKRKGIGDLSGQNNRNKERYLPIAKMIEDVIDDCESGNTELAQILLKKIGVAETKKMRELKKLIRKAMKHGDDPALPLRRFMDSIYVNINYNENMWDEESLKEYFERD